MINRRVLLAPALPIDKGKNRGRCKKSCSLPLTSEVISTLALSRAWKRERSGRWKASAAVLGSAGGPHTSTPTPWLSSLRHIPPYPAEPHVCLSDHLGRLEEKHRGDGKAEGLGGLEVDDQLEFYRLLHREISRLGAFEDFVHVGGRTPI